MYNNNFVVVCQHPHKVNTLLVFPEVGNGDYDLTINVLHHLYRSNHDIQLVRYTEDNIQKLNRNLDLREFNSVSIFEISFGKDVKFWVFDFT